MKYIDNKDD